ncbi:MAG: SGNH/GDSL hydrolase family protein [Balneolaceae bacterium]
MNFIFTEKFVLWLTKILKQLDVSSLRITLFYFFAIAFLSQCSPSPQTSNIENNGISHPTTIKYLALGDSYTIGESVPEPMRWPLQLTDSLIKNGIETEKVDIIARTGWTTAELKQGIIDNPPSPPYDLVSLLIGVNNQYRGYDIEIYRIEFRELLEQAIEFANNDSSRVFVVSIPNYGVTPFGQSRGEDKIRKELLEYDRIAKEIATEYNIPFINITPISEKAKENLTFIASDNLHPSGEMYSEWVHEMLPTVLSLIEQ